MSDILDVALDNAAKKYKVFPLAPGTKVPRANSNGFYDAVSETDEVEKLFSASPDFGLAIRTGQESGFCVLDIDTKNDDGFASLEKLEEECGESLRDTYTTGTPNGGIHVYFEVKRNDPDTLSVTMSQLIAPDASDIVSKSKFRPGIDWRGESGYVVAPPTRVTEGTGGYTVLADRPVATLPESLHHRLREWQRPKSLQNGSVRTQDSRPKRVLRIGERIDGIVNYSATTWHRTNDEEAVQAATEAFNAKWVDPPLSQDEVNKIVASAVKYRRNRPFARDDDPATWEITPELRAKRVLTGDVFILDEPVEIPAIWGQGEQVLHAAGEGLVLVGHQGVGKSTLAQQYVLHRMGIRSGGLLGLPVVTSEKPVVYLAMDRPRQIARSVRRMVSEEDRALLRNGLFVWKGPLPNNPTKNPRVLADFVAEIAPSAGLVVVDSMKDLAPGISNDEVGAALNSAFQEVIARGIELVVLHHERKASQGDRRLHSLDDVYGSVWLTAGMGSVVVLEGEPGDPHITLRHLKQPAEPVGPLDLQHDHATGTTRLHAAPSLLVVLRTAGPNGMTAEELALLVLGRSSGNDIKTIKRRLEKQIKVKAVELINGRMTSQGREPNRYRLTGLGNWIGGLE